LVSSKKGADGASRGGGISGKYIAADTNEGAACIRDRIIREGKQRGLHPRAKLNFATQEEAADVAAQATAAFEQDMQGKKRRKKYRNPGTKAKPRPSIPWENPSS